MESNRKHQEVRGHVIGPEFSCLNYITVSLTSGDDLAFCDLL